MHHKLGTNRTARRTEKLELHAASSISLVIGHPIPADLMNCKYLPWASSLFPLSLFLLVLTWAKPELFSFCLHGAGPQKPVLKCPCSCGLQGYSESAPGCCSFDTHDIQWMPSQALVISQFVFHIPHYCCLNELGERVNCSKETCDCSWRRCCSLFLVLMSTQEKHCGGKRY